MNFTNLVQMAMDTAIAGTDPDTNVINKMTMEVETLGEQVIHQLVEEVRADPRLRARCMKQFTVALAAGVGSVPATLLIQYLGEGGVRDSDSGAPDGVGNRLSRVLHENDFFGYLSPVFGYYHIKADASAATQILTRNIGNSYDFTGTVGPLIITAPYTPTKLNVTEWNSEITDRAVQLLAIRLRGLIPGMPAAA